MPRESKAATDESHAKTLDIAYFRALTRPQIQVLAKSYGVKANLKTEKIIADILAKEKLKVHRSPSVALPEHSKTTNESQELVSPEGPLVAGGSVPAKKMPKRITKRAAPDQPSRETKAPKRARRGETVAQQPLHSNQDAEIQSQEPLAMGGTQHIDPEELRVLTEKTPISNETPASNNEPQVSGGGFQAVDTAQETSGQTAPATNSKKKPTVKNIRDVHKLLAELSEDHKKLRSELDGTKANLTFAMDTLEKGTMFVKEMSFRRQLYERDIVDKLKKVDHSWGMTPEDTNEWQEFLIKSGDPSGQPGTSKPSEGAVVGEGTEVVSVELES